MSFSTHTTLAEGAASAQRRAITGASLQRARFRLSDIWKAPLHDFPIRDEILYQYLPLAADMDVLEIGPGSGFTAFRIARQVHSLTLVDVAAESLDEVRKNLQGLANMRCVCADATRPGLAASLGQEFDAAFALDVFEYAVDPATCLRNFAEVLRPSGELFLTFPNLPPPLGDGMTYFSKLSEIDRLLRQARFRSWDVFVIRLRPYPALVYRVLHEWPLQVYRRLRRKNGPGCPQVYDATWAFQQRQKLRLIRLPLHLFWVGLGGAMRLGGDAFASGSPKTAILGQQLIIRAWK